MTRQILAARLDISRGAGKTILSAPRQPFFSHPWQKIQLLWSDSGFGSKGTFGAWLLVLKPGFVNGIDPIMKDCVGFNRAITSGGGVISSNQAAVGGAQDEVFVYSGDDYSLTPKTPYNLPLLGYPMMALNFSRATSWPQAKPTPYAIQNMGVAANDFGGNGMTLSVDSGSNLTAITKPTSGPAPSTFTVAKSIDIVLAQSRPILNQSLQVTGDLLSGTMVIYTTDYSSEAMKQYGLRPFVYQVPSWDVVEAQVQAFQGNSWFSIFHGDSVADDGLDKQWIMRIWAVSPPMPTGTKTIPDVDGSWNLQFQYKTFTNLAYQSKRPPLYNAPSSTPFFTGLAAGVGDAIINSYLSLQNDLTDHLTQDAFNQTPIGKFWSI